MPLLALIAGYIIVFFVAALALLLVFWIVKGKIDLRLLVSEKEGPASLSRFQFLIFTFVVSICLLVLTLESGEFPRVGQDILGLLGISGGSYLVSKGIQRSAKTESTQVSVETTVKKPE